jgi:endonuclease G
LGLIEDSGKALANEAVSIVQHPEGADKQIALRNNHILGVMDDFIHYTTDTKTGSSGAPVFNDQWQVVALHHLSVARRNDRGEVITPPSPPPVVESCTSYEIALIR